MNELLNRLPIRPDLRLPLAIGCAGLVVAASVFSCCGGAALLALRPRAVPAASAPSTRAQQDSGVSWKWLQNDSSRKLSADALDMLAAAAAEDAGRVTFSILVNAGGEPTIFAGKKKICEPKDGPRASARWQQAVDDLTAAGCLEFERTTVVGDRVEFRRFRVTAAGFELADAIAK